MARKATATTRRCRTPPNPPDPGTPSIKRDYADYVGSTRTKKVPSSAQPDSTTSPISSVRDAQDPCGWGNLDELDPDSEISQAEEPLSEEEPIITSELDQDSFSVILHTFLGKKKFGKRRCCKYFLSRQRDKSLLMYRKGETDGLGKFASTVLDCLAEEYNDILKLSDMINKSEDAALAYIDKEKKNKSVTYSFLDSIMTKTSNRPTLGSIKTIISDWYKELLETYFYYNSSEVSSTKMRNLYVNVIDNISKCRNDVYIKELYKLLCHIESKKQLVNPFFFVCAPSGSGKTALAYNLARYKCPMLYFVLNEDWNQETQSLYKPFEFMSKELSKVLNADLDSFMGPKNKHKHPVKTSSRQLLTQKNYKKRTFNTVHSIVSLFQKLIEIQKTNDKSWMEAQLSIDRLKDGKMSL